MNFTQKPRRSVSCFVVAALLYVMMLFANIGCASPQRAGFTVAQFAREFDIGAGRIGILEPEMFLYDVSEGGVLEYRDDWSVAASRHTARQVALMLKMQGYTPLIIPDPHRSRDFFLLTTSMRLHSAVLREEYLAAGRSPFSGSLDFSIGVLREISDYYGVDGFLFIYGFQEHFSDERRRYIEESGLNIGERTHVAALLAKRCGRVAWYHYVIGVGGGGVDLGSFFWGQGGR